MPPLTLMTLLFLRLGVCLVQRRPIWLVMRTIVHAIGESIGGF